VVSHKFIHMKKVSVFLLLFVFSSIITNAQNKTGGGGFRIGGKVGANLNKISGQSFNDGFEYAYHAGAFVEIDFTKKFGIQPELLWSQTSTKPATTLAPIYQTLPTDLKLNYFSIPILLRYNIGNMLTLHAGPQFSILMNKNDNLLQNGSNAFKNGDLALVLGAQVNLKMLRVYGRYNAGLNNINDFSNQEKWTNRQIQLGIGIKL